jgi:hypothetical protein
MVNEMLSSIETAERLGITMNNLRQIQHRKSLVWRSSKGRNVFYDKAEVEAYAAKREARKK